MFLNNLYRNQQILTFYGIRKAESVSRSKYNRVEGNSESVKIQKQTVASPIFFCTPYCLNCGERLKFKLIRESIEELEKKKHDKNSYFV